MTSSGPGGIQAHIKAIKVMMQKFHRQSQGSSRYTVHGMKERWTSQSVHTFKARFPVMAENTCRQFLPQKLSLQYLQREVWQWVISAMTGIRLNADFCLDIHADRN